MVALRGVVVDDVEDHLDAGAVQRLDHALELAHLLAAVARRGVGRVRREEADRGVAPVVRQPLRVEEVLVGDVVHRQQLDRRDAERLQVRDRVLGGQPGVRPAQVLAHARAQLREALDVRLVDHGLVPRRAQPAVALPVEARDRSRRTSGSRRRRPRRRARGRRPRSPVGTYGSTLPASKRIGPSIDFAYGSSSSLLGLKRWPSFGAYGTVDAVAVALAGADEREVAVPVERRAPRSARSAPRRRRSSNRHSSTRVAFSEKSEKFVPPPSQVAPSGNGSPGQISLIAARPRRAARARRRSRRRRSARARRRAATARRRSWRGSGTGRGAR